MDKPNAAPTDKYLLYPHRFRLWCAVSHGHDLLEHEKGELVTFEDYQAILHYLLSETAKRDEAEHLVKEKDKQIQVYQDREDHSYDRIKEAERKLVAVVKAARYFATAYEIGDESGELQHWPKGEIDACKAVYDAIAALDKEGK